MSRPWMPLYIADYLADTAHLRAPESGAYLHLIMHYWRRGSLPDNDRQLATIAKMTDVLGRLDGVTAATGASRRWRLPQVDCCVPTQPGSILRRLKTASSQLVRVEHVHVHARGQAVVGVVETGGDGPKSEDHPANCPCTSAPGVGRAR